MDYLPIYYTSQPLGPNKSLFHYFDQVARAYPVFTIEIEYYILCTHLIQSVHHNNHNFGIFGVWSSSGLANLCFKNLWFENVIMYSNCR